VPVKGWILHIPAFAEEMNKARPMVHQTAEQLTQQGFVVVLLDLFGTGDSAGEFGSASWHKWQEDIVSAVGWMQAQGAASITLWGFRLGCLLAVQLISEGSLTVAGLLLWQPVYDGRQFMTQFLRLRVASSMMSNEPETVAMLRTEIAAAGYLDIAGYQISGELLGQVECLALRDMPLPAGTSVSWLEVAADPDKPPAPVARAIVDQWQASGAEVGMQCVRGERFWATQEIALAPDLVAATMQAFDVLCTNALPVVPDQPAKRPSPPVQEPSGKERGVTFACQGDELVGVLHAAGESPLRGIVLVVGGPQYRVGSHRQFVHFARKLAAHGIPVLRFDYRGMGDSQGEFSGFEGIHDDIACAIDEFCELVPSVREVVLVGLCDAATATCFYAPSDPRITGLILLNPWVRSVEGEARTLLRHYYIRRLFSAQFWRKLARGRLNFTGSVASLSHNLGKALGARPRPSQSLHGGKDASGGGGGVGGDSSQPLASRMEACLAAYTGQLLLVLSGRDLTAAEFRDNVNTSAGFKTLLSSPRVSQYELSDADHTFSRKIWKDQMAQWAVDWMKSW